MENKNQNAEQRYQASRIFTVRNKLLLIFLALSLIPMGILSTVVFRNASNALLNDAFAALEAVQATKQQQIETFFEQITIDARFIRELPARHRHGRTGRAANFDRTTKQQRRPRLPGRLRQHRGHLAALCRQPPGLSRHHAG